MRTVLGSTEIQQRSYEIDAFGRFIIIVELKLKKKFRMCKKEQEELMNSGNISKITSSECFSDKVAKKKSYS